MFVGFILSLVIKYVDGDDIKNEENYKNLLIGKNLKYSLFSENKKIGNSYHKIERTGKGYIFSEVSDVNVSKWWGKIDITSNFVEVYDSEGKLLNSNNIIMDGKKLYHLRTYLDDNEYFMSYKKMKKITKSEIVKINKLEDSISNEEIHAGKIEKVYGDIFSERNRLEKDVFDVDKFDTTFNYLPLYLQENQKENKSMISIYSPEDMEIKNRKIIDLGWKEIMLDDVLVHTRHFSLVNKKSAPINIWIAEYMEDNKLEIKGKDIEKVVPYLVRLTTRDEYGEVEVILESSAAIF